MSISGSAAVINDFLKDAFGQRAVFCIAGRVLKARFEPELRGYRIT